MAKVILSLHDQRRKHLSKTVNKEGLCRGIEETYDPGSSIFGDGKKSSMLMQALPLGSAYSRSIYTSPFPSPEKEGVNHGGGLPKKPDQRSEIKEKID